MKIFYLIFVFVISNIIAQVDVDKHIKIEKFNPLSEPSSDLKAAIKIAKKENKNILLDVGGEWCIWCRRIDSFFVSNKNIYDLLHSNFVVLKVNFSKENKNEKFLSNYPKINGYPHFFVLNKKGEFVHSQDTGELEEGKGYSVDKTMDFLKKWSIKK